MRSSGGNGTPRVHPGRRRGRPKNAVLAGGQGTGYPFVNVKAVLFDGKAHDVDSERDQPSSRPRDTSPSWQACQETNSTLLEPIMKIEVRVPEEFLGSRGR